MQRLIMGSGNTLLLTRAMDPLTPSVFVAQWGAKITLLSCEKSIGTCNHLRHPHTSTVVASIQTTNLPSCKALCASVEVGERPPDFGFEGLQPLQRICQTALHTHPCGFLPVWATRDGRRDRTELLPDAAPVQHRAYRPGRRFAGFRLRAWLQAPAAHPTDPALGNCFR
jgi:hypothetical protein